MMEDIKEFAGKKVLIIVENLPVPLDRRVWQEALALKEKGAQVTVICPIGKGYDNRFEVKDGIHIYRHRLIVEAKKGSGYFLEYFSAIFWEFVLTFKCIFKRGFHVIHACNPPDLIWIIGLFFKILGKKFIFDHHDLCPELYYAKFGKKNFFYRLMFILEKITFRLSDISIATNESYRKIAIERGEKDPDKVFVVRSGPDINKFKKVKPNQDLRSGKEYLVGYLGVIGKQEGLDYLIDACQYIVNDNDRKDIHFICVGGGTNLENIRNYTKEKGLDKYFTFTGRVSDKKLLEALSTADLCVNPDTFNELNDKSTMNKIMEYMALGKPIVQFDMLEGKRSALEASLYAKNNDPKDLAYKIIELIDDPDRRKKMGDFGYQRLTKELSWNRQKEELYKAYRCIFK